MKNFLMVLAFTFAWAGALRAADPAWWTDSGTSIVDAGASHAISENYKAANAGQLKHVAAMAKLHLDARLPGGAGLAIENLVAGFEPRAGVTYSPSEEAAILSAQYAPINLGQLKAVAQPFYDRLLSVGIDTNAHLAGTVGFTDWTHDYPWEPGTAADVNYRVANLGQLKAVFAFAVTGGLFSMDANHNGAADTGDDFDGDGVTNGQEMTDNTDPFNAASAVSPPTPQADTTGANGLKVFTMLR